MKTIFKLIPLGVGLVVAAVLIKPSVAQSGGSRDDDDREVPRSTVQRGLAISPVHLNLHNRNRALVGLGSYLVNAVAACNDCHSCPSYAAGHSPYTGGDGQINSESFLAGGVQFGPFVSANITPGANGLPAGLTLSQFVRTLRTGHEPSTGDILQVMPWPIYSNMTDRDLVAIYEYLRAIPHADTPTNHCPAPGM